MIKHKKIKVFLISGMFALSLFKIPNIVKSDNPLWLAGLLTPFSLGLCLGWQISDLNNRKEEIKFLAYKYSLPIEIVDIYLDWKNKNKKRSLSSIYSDLDFIVHSNVIIDSSPADIEALEGLLSELI